MMKRLVSLCIAVLLAAFFAPGCAKEAANADVVAIDTSDTALPTDGGVTLTPFGNESAPKGTVAVETAATVAYAYADKDGQKLYGAAAFKNTGSASVVLKNASFVFRADGKEVSHEFEPVLNAYDVVAPGESSFVALWLENDGIPAGAAVTLEASFTPEAAGNARFPIAVNDLFLADNYPKFTTLSGTLQNAAQEDCAFIMTQAAFYGQSEELLGVWYFVKNMRLSPGDTADFVTYMKELPVNGLSQSVKEIKARAFGFN